MHGMNIRIVQNDLKWLLCVGYKRELGVKGRHPEPFLFFTPDLPKKIDREAIMIRLADLLVERLRGKTWALVAVKILDFKDYAETVASLADFADVFGTAEAWKENLELFTRQRKSLRNRLTGTLGSGTINMKEFITSVMGSKKSAT
jgi:hypothetical protein